MESSGLDFDQYFSSKYFLTIFIHFLFQSMINFKPYTCTSCPKGLTSELENFGSSQVSSSSLAVFDISRSSLYSSAHFWSSSSSLSYSPALKVESTSNMEVRNCKINMVQCIQNGCSSRTSEKDCQSKDNLLWHDKGIGTFKNSHYKIWYWYFLNNMIP